MNKLLLIISLMDNLVFGSHDPNSKGYMQKYTSCGNLNRIEHDYCTEALQRSGDGTLNLYSPSSCDTRDANIEWITITANECYEAIISEYSKEKKNEGCLEYMKRIPDDGKSSCRLLVKGN